MTDMTTVITTLRKNSREEVRISLRVYKDMHLVDIRIFVDTGRASQRVPTKKGVAIKIDALPDLIAALEEAGNEAQRRGLVPPGSRQHRSSQVRRNASKPNSSPTKTKDETYASQQNEFLFPNSEN